MLALPVEIIHHEIIKWLPNKDYYNLLLSNSAFNVLSENEINYRKYNGKNLTDLYKKGDLNGVKYLVSVGADIHVENELALIRSAYYGHLEVVKYLVSVGADIHAHNDLPLLCSAAAGHLEIVKYLVSLGADIHAYNDSVPLYSGFNGNFEIVEYLVSISGHVKIF